METKEMIHIVSQMIFLAEQLNSKKLVFQINYLNMTPEFNKWLTENTRIDQMSYSSTGICGFEFK